MQIIQAPRQCPPNQKRKILEKLQHQIRGKTRNLARDPAPPGTWRRFLSLPAPSFLVASLPETGEEEGEG
jgi:hypothetical protein